MLEQNTGMRPGIISAECHKTVGAHVFSAS